MCDWNSGSWPFFTRSREISSRGRTKPSSLSLGQWSVCSAMLTGYFLATSSAYAAKATEPVTMSLTVGPERYSAPPVETWMMPSLPASEKPARAALRVCEDDTLMAGNANDFDFAASSISAYFSGVAMGISRLLKSPDGVRDNYGSTLVPPPLDKHPCGRGNRGRILLPVPGRPPRRSTSSGDP